MKISLYLLPNRVGLKFENSPERDQFWAGLSDAARASAERIKSRTIRFLPDQMKDPNGLVIPLVSNGAVSVAVAPTKPAGAPKPAPPPQPAVQPGIVNVSSGDPFAIRGDNPVKPLPGMVAVQSNIPVNAPQSDLGGIQTPPGDKNAPEGQIQPVAASPGASPEAQTPSKQEPNAGKGPHGESEPTDDDPEPPDKRTKAYRLWFQRHHPQSK